MRRQCTFERSNARTALEKLRQLGVGTLSVLIALSVSAWAQSPPEEIFVLLRSPALSAAAQASSVARAVVDRVVVGMRIDRLFEASDPAARVQLSFANVRWIARFTRIDREDVSGFRSWVGAVEGVEYSHIVFTERDGVVSGLIDAVSTTYQLRTLSPGIYVIEQLDLSAIGLELDPLRGGEQAQALNSTDAAQDDGSTIDVLLLYTPNARVAAGGTSQIQAIASQVISNSNTIFDRSNVATRMRLVGTHEFALTEAASMQTDLSAVTSSPTARALRNGAAADLVQLLVSSPDLSSCGIAWLLTSLSSDFNAYSVADIACVGQYTPTHEMAHNMGSHHAPEDGAGGALYPYSYGYKNPPLGFRTVMAYTCAGTTCPRIANMSSPGVTHLSSATGTPLQDNARSINNVTLTVANWRQSQTTPPPNPLPPPPGTPTAPATPTGLQSQVNGTNVTLLWNASAPGRSAATFYTLQVGNVSGASNLFNASVGNTTMVSGNVPTGAYFWRVIASNSASSSAPSAESMVNVGAQCTTPGAPQGFNFSVSGRLVTLSWNSLSTGGVPIAYIIEAGSASGLADLFYGSTGNTGTTVSALAPPGSYFVRIRAQNACGLSTPSNEQFIVVQ